MKDSTSYILPKNRYGRNALLCASMFVAITANATPIANVGETSEGFSRFAVVHTIESISNTGYHSLTNAMVEEENDFFDVEFVANPHYVSKPLETIITKISQGEISVVDDLFEELDDED